MCGCYLVDVFDIFYFFLIGGGEGSPWRKEGAGIGCLLKILEGGGSPMIPTKVVLPTFWSSRNRCVFVLRDLLRTD